MLAAQGQNRKQTKIRKSHKNVRVRYFFQEMIVTKNNRVNVRLTWIRWTDTRFQMNNVAP